MNSETMNTAVAWLKDQLRMLEALQHSIWSRLVKPMRLSELYTVYHWWRPCFKQDWLSGKIEKVNLYLIMSQRSFELNYEWLPIDESTTIGPRAWPRNTWSRPGIAMNFCKWSYNWTFLSFVATRLGYTWVTPGYYVTQFLFGHVGYTNFLFKI